MYSTTTIIVGSEQCRRSFNPSLTSLITARTYCIIVDALLLPTIEPVITDNCHFAIVISNSRQLNHALTLIRQQVERDTERKILIAGCVSCKSERAAIRLIALKFAHCGIALSCDEEVSNDGRIESSNDSGKDNLNVRGRALTLFDCMLEEWSEDHEVWGNATWIAGNDLIIPPEWDSESKIRAVVEANELSFENDIQPLSTTTHMEVNDDDEKRRIDSVVNVGQWFASHVSWMESMNQMVVDEKEKEKMEKRRKEESIKKRSHPPPNPKVSADYFRRLLSSANK